MTMTKMTSCVLAALLLVATLAQADDTGPSAEAEAAHRAGIDHLRDGRTDLAIDEFKRAVSKATKGDSTAAYYYSSLGKALMRRGVELGRSGQKDQAKKRFVEAEEALRKALVIHPYFVDVHNDLGLALIYQDRRTEGKKEYLAAYNDPQNPNPEQTAYNLGQANLEEKNWVEAGSWFQTSINRNKTFAEAYLGLSDTQVASGREDEACVTLDSGVKANPDHAGLLVALGECLLKKGRLAEARTRLEEAAKKDTVGPVGLRATELLKTLPAPAPSPR